MLGAVAIGGVKVGPGQPVHVVAEIGINHNGDLEIAKRLIDAAADSGCDAVKFQKRTPEECIPVEQRSKMRDTPWGYITYLEYRRKVEFGEAEYRMIDEYCRRRQINWFASVWDEGALQFIQQFAPVCVKIPSPTLTNLKLLRSVRSLRIPVILSTGMSTMDEIRTAVETLGLGQLILCHCNSSYPAAPHELNLRVIQTLCETFGCPTGYSGHEVGLATTVAAVALGACLIERHITLDRGMWGSDHSASVEPEGFRRLVRYIRAVESALGDGRKCVYASEEQAKKRLRGDS